MKPKIDRATAISTEPCVTVQQKVTSGHKHYAAMQKSSDWTDATDVQKAGGDMDAASTSLETNAALIDSLTAQLSAARANQPILVRRWAATKRRCLSAVTTFCDGSKDKVLAFGFDVFSPQPIPPAGAPQNLRDKHSKVHGEACVTWDIAQGRPDYMVQCASNPADPTTYTAPVAVSRATFKLAGQTPGATVHIRVLTIDSKLPSGQSPYTDWVAAMVGA